MSHSCFISFKKEDAKYRDEIEKKLGKERIPGKSLDKWIDSNDIDYVMSVIRKEYMNNTTVTLFLIGEHSSENEGLDNQGRNKQAFIIRELQATLYDGKGNPRDGLLGIVLPEMYNKVYGASYQCEHCGSIVKYIYMNDKTVIREFSENYYLKKDNCGHYSEDTRFCVLVRYDDFINDPETYIDKAYNKTKKPIANSVHYKDIVHQGMK